MNPHTARCFVDMLGMRTAKVCFRIEQRRAARVDCANLARVLLEPGSTPLTAVVEDISDLGMRVSVPTPLLRGDVIVLQTASGVRRAIIRHCEWRQQDGAYDIGLEFLTGQGDKNE